MSRKTTPDKLAKFLGYILENRPDEFGMIPDADGWYRLKDLLKVFAEEAGWRHIRMQDLNEVRMTRPNPPFILKEGAIRGRATARLPTRVVVEKPPKLLFTCIRRRAYPHVAREGISPSIPPDIISASDRSLAERIGKRIDREAILLTIHTTKALELGIVFERFGERLFLSGHIPSECFSGPPLPKETEKTLSGEPKTDARPASQTPGSFFIDPAEITPTGVKADRKGAKKEIPWKKQRKRMKRRQGGTEKF